MGRGWLLASILSSLLRLNAQTALETLSPASGLGLDLVVQPLDGKRETHSVSLDRPQVVKERAPRDAESVRQIRISGRITLSGAPAPGLHVGFSKSKSICSTISMHAPMARTDEDGRFELTVSEAAHYFVSVRSADGWTQLPCREVDVPAYRAHLVELAEEFTAVAGIVVDQASGEPIPYARVDAHSKDRHEQRSSVRTIAESDGRFQLRAFAEGGYELTAHADGYVRTKLETSLSSGEELRIALTRAAGRIRGRVVDAESHGIAGLSVVANQWSDWRSAKSLRDGVFEIRGLWPVAHNLCVGSARSGFAVASNVLPSDEEVLLELRPAGRIRLIVSGPDGALSGALADLSKVDDDQLVRCWGVTPQKSDSNGALEIVTPAGVVELEMTHENEHHFLEGTVTVTVGENDVAVAVVTLVAPEDEP